MRRSNSLSGTRSFQQGVRQLYGRRQMTPEGLYGRVEMRTFSDRTTIPAADGIRAIIDVFSCRIVA